MKSFFLLIHLMLLSVLVHCQSLPIDFESAITTSDFINFDGGEATVVDNPFPDGINTSNTVAQIVREGGEIWAGSKIDLADRLDFTTLSSLSMKVYTTAPVGTTVKFKLEGNGDTERDVRTTVSSEWEVLTWDFTGEPASFNSIVFMFDFGRIGDGSENSTFLFDDVEQLYNGKQIDFPVDFEDAEVNYTMSDFGGNISSLVADPTDAENTVVKVIKPEQAATWAGTTIGTPAGFASDIPLSMSESVMTVRVWSPEAGTPIRLKVEDSNDPTHTCETETVTTVGGAWEVMVFDFSQQALGTELLSIGLDRGWRYNMASIFFDFGTDGLAAGEETYYFDEVRFGNFSSLGSEQDRTVDIKVLPNPTAHLWTIEAEEEISLIQLFDLQGRLLLSRVPGAKTCSLSATGLSNGLYISKVSTFSGISYVQLGKQ